MTEEREAKEREEEAQKQREEEAWGRRQGGGSYTLASGGSGRKACKDRQK